MELLGHLDYVLCYIDDILILQRTHETEADHLRKIETVLSLLEEAGFKANLRKSFFMQKEIEYLGYQLTSKGLECQPKKLEAIQRILPPTNVKQLKRFIGMVTFYRDVFPRRSHVMSPLTDLAAECGKRKGSKPKSPWKWERKHQEAFEECKKMLVEHATLAFPDFSKPFYLWADASDIQLGATLVQDNRPLGFYTRKLNAAQRNYTVGEKELLSLCEGLKAFDGMIRGFDITIMTDHLNLLYQKLPNQRMSRWRLLMEEYAPKVMHTAGELNLAADALSRLPMKLKHEDEVEWEVPNPPLKYADEDGEVHIFQMMAKIMSEFEFEPDGFDETLCPVSTRAQSEFNDLFPLSIKRMRDDQEADSKLMKEVADSIKKKKCKYS